MLNNNDIQWKRRLYQAKPELPLERMEEVGQAAWVARGLDGRPSIRRRPARLGSRGDYRRCRVEFQSKVIAPRKPRRVHNVAEGAPGRMLDERSELDRKLSHREIPKSGIFPAIMQSNSPSVARPESEEAILIQGCSMAQFLTRIGRLRCQFEL